MSLYISIDLYNVMHKIKSNDLSGLCDLGCVSTSKNSFYFIGHGGGVQMWFDMLGDESFKSVIELKDKTIKFEYNNVDSSLWIKLIIKTDNKFVDLIYTFKFIRVDGKYNIIEAYDTNTQCSITDSDLINKLLSV